MAVRGYLNAVRETPGQVGDESICGLAASVADDPRHHQLGVGIEGGPSPNVARSLRRGLCSRHVLRLGVAERPNLIELEPSAREIVERLLLVLAAGFASVYQQFHDGDDGTIDDP